LINHFVCGHRANDEIRGHRKVIVEGAYVDRHARFILHMADAVGFEKVSKVAGARGRPQVPVKWQTSQLEMSKGALNGGWQGLRFQVGLEHAIEELVRYARLEPEQASIVVEFLLRQAAKE